LIVNIALTPSQRPLRASLTISVAILMGRYSRRVTRGFSFLVFDLLRALASTISSTGDPEVPTTRRVGPKAASELQCNRLALYRVVDMNLGESTFYAFG